MHIHCNDWFTRALANSVGCNFEILKDGNLADISSVVSIDEKAEKLDVNPSIRKILPPVSVDGPFGCRFGGLFEKEVVVLVGIDRNVT